MFVAFNITRKVAGVFALLCMLSACSSQPKLENTSQSPAYFDTQRMLEENEHDVDGNVYDPLEGLNRSIYGFNYRFDRYIFLPIVSGYKAITPDFLEVGIHNFFENILQVPTFINSVFQLQFEKTYETFGRFAVNSTVGLLGFFDVATAWDMPKHKEDFGQTLGYWGVGSGPYLVLPVLGPSNLRDGFALMVDSIAVTELREELKMKDEEGLAIDLLNAIDTRANVDFRYYDTSSAFEYELVRTLWQSKRELEIEK